MCDFGISKEMIYYTHVPVMICGVLLAFFVYLSGKKSSINRYFFAFIIFFIFWNGNDLAQWLITDPFINLFLARIAIVESFSIIALLFFAYAFSGRNLSLKQKIAFNIPVIPLLAFMFTDHNALLVGGDLCQVQFGSLYWYLYIFILVYLGHAIYILIEHYHNDQTNQNIKNQIVIIIGAFAFFVLWFVLMMVLTWYFVTRQNPIGDSLFLFTPFGILVFIGMVAYAITKYQFLNIKSIAAQILTYTIWILISTQYFFATSLLSVMIVTFTLLLSILFGTMLIHYMKVEMQQKKELEIANAKLRELDETKSEFISMASHQLRTPLTSMKGFVSLLKNGTYGKVPEGFEEPLAYVENANDRLIMLVEDMLNVSRIELGQMKLDYKKGDINDLAMELYQSFTVLAHKKELDLHIKQSSEKLFVKMDYNAVREAVSNVIDNAIKYTTKGNVMIEVQKKDDKALLLITDTGIGISEKEFNALFDKFVRGKRAQQVKKGGAGLGLYIGKKIIEAHHGRVYARSEGRGKGTTFIIELPLMRV